MLRVKIIFLIICSSLVFCATTFAQDVSFAQFFANHLYLNPAYAGNPKHQSVQLVYRNQWLTTQSPFMSYGVSYDRFFIEKGSGIGINIINDMQAGGAINRLSADFMYSFNVQVAYNIQIRGGIQAGGIFKSQNTSSLIFPDMIDNSGEIVGSPNFSGVSTVIPDFAAGIAGEWGIFYGGIAVHHIAEPIETQFTLNQVVLPRKYTVNAGLDINLYKRYLFRKSLVLSPNIIYQQQLNFRQINLGALLSHQYITAGIWLRESLNTFSHTFVFLAGYHDENWSFAYSYDFSIIQGGFRNINTSSHEVTFEKKFQYKTRSRKKIRQIKYPKF